MRCTAQYSDGITLIIWICPAHQFIIRLYYSHLAQPLWQTIRAVQGFAGSLWKTVGIPIGLMIPYIIPRIQYGFWYPQTTPANLTSSFSPTPTMPGLCSRIMRAYITIITIMMTSSNGNLFRVTGPLCGVFTGHRWIPSTKASDAEFWCFLWSAPE